MLDTVLFHDGGKFTAEDVAFTLQRVAAIQTTAANFSEYVKSIVHVDIIVPQQLRITTNGPFPLLPDYLTAIGIVSRTHGETEALGASRNERGAAGEVELLDAGKGRGLGF